MLKKVINRYYVAFILLTSSMFSAMLVPAVIAHATPSSNVGSWTTQTNSLPANLVVANSVVSNGYVYVFGGFDGSGGVNTVFSAPIDSSGNVGEWMGQGNTPMPVPLYGSAAVVYNGYVFIIGGGDTSDPTNGHATQEVYSAPLNDGIVGDWTALSTILPIGLLFHTATASNGYVYVMGGVANDPDGNQFSSSAVFSAQLNNDGTLGVWATQNNVLPYATVFSTSIASNGYLYIFGGDDNQPTDAVYSAPINSGVVGAWTATQSLPQKIYGMASVLYNGRAYILGGINENSNVIANVYSASIGNGVIGQWTDEGNSLPQTLAYSTSVVNNGFVYTIAGGNNFNVANFVFSAQLYESLPQSFEVVKNTSTTIPVLTGSVDDPDSASLTILTQPLHGIATAGRNGITYTPSNGYTGSDSLLYRICSIGDSSRCSTVTLTLTVALQAPTTGFGGNFEKPFSTLLMFLSASSLLLSLALLSKKLQSYN